MSNSESEESENEELPLFQPYEEENEAVVVVNEDNEDLDLDNLGNETHEIDSHQESDISEVGDGFPSEEEEEDYVFPKGGRWKRVKERIKEADKKRKARKKKAMPSDPEYTESEVDQDNEEQEPGKRKVDRRLSLGTPKRRKKKPRPSTSDASPSEEERITKRRGRSRRRTTFPPDECMERDEAGYILVSKMLYNPEERIRLKTVDEAFNDVVMDSRKAARLKWSRAFKKNCGTWMKDRIIQQAMENSRRHGYGFNSVEDMREQWTNAVDSERRLELADKFIDIYTKRYFRGEEGRSWKYRAEREYMRERKLKYKENNEYDGCIARQATRALGDVMKRINSGVRKGHGWIFSLKGWSPFNESTFVAVKKARNRTTPMVKRTVTRTKEGLLRMAADKKSKLRRKSKAYSTVDSERDNSEYEDDEEDADYSDNVPGRVNQERGKKLYDTARTSGGRVLEKSRAEGRGKKLYDTARTSSGRGSEMSRALGGRGSSGADGRVTSQKEPAIWNSDWTGTRLPTDLNQVLHLFVYVDRI
jgi:hypothetical protein